MTRNVWLRGSIVAVGVPASGVEQAQKHVGIDDLRTGDLSDVGGHPACNRQSDDFGWVRS